MNYLKRSACAVATAAALSTFVGCGGGGSGTPAGKSANIPPAVAAAQRGASPVPASIVTANNNLGFQLVTQMRTTDSGKNVFISPTSVALCFEILYNGAAGTTQTSMAQTLGLTGFSVSDVNSDNAALQASLISTDPAVALTIANSFWYHKASGQILPSFINTDTQYYGSYIGDIAGGPGPINSWVSQQTNGKIPTIVGSEVSNYVAMAINAVYFSGSWTGPFDPSQTEQDLFTLANGSTVTCSMMHSDNAQPYFVGSNFQAVEMPYGKGRDVMLVFLPNPGVSVDTVLGEITTANLAAWLPQFKNEVGSLSLPKFTSSYTSNLKPVLSTLGMSVAFDPNNANFSNMGPALFLDTAVHETYLSINEGGTVAAAVTSVGVGVSSAPVINYTMNVNRPFVSAILDTQTGEILFYGVIDDPSV